MRAGASLTTRVAAVRCSVLRARRSLLSTLPVDCCNAACGDEHGARQKSLRIRGAVQPRHASLRTHALWSDPVFALHTSCELTVAMRICNSVRRRVNMPIAAAERPRSATRRAAPKRHACRSEPYHARRPGARGEPMTAAEARFSPSQPESRAAIGPCVGIRTLIGRLVLAQLGLVDGQPVMATPSGRKEVIVSIAGGAKGGDATSTLPRTSTSSRADGSVFCDAVSWARRTQGVAVHAWTCDSQSAKRVSSCSRWWRRWFSWRTTVARTAASGTRSSAWSAAH